MSQIETLDNEEYAFQRIVNDALVRRIPVEVLLKHIDDLDSEKGALKHFGHPWLLVHFESGVHIGYESEASARAAFADLPKQFWTMRYRPQLDH